jgi:hypothetical protein
MKMGTLVLTTISCCILLSGCGESKPERPPNQEQIAFFNEWTNENATDAQIDALRTAPPRQVKEWQATVKNVTEKSNYTVIHTEFRNQTYELWIFEPEARVKARQMYAKTDVVFSGQLLEEKSITRAGAKENPEFGVYASRIIGGGLEIAQSAEGIARELELDEAAKVQARAKSTAETRDSINEDRTVAYCKELVTKKLKYPVSGAFSWFQGKTRKESDTKWTYTDVVTSVDHSGSKQSARFICTTTIRNESITGQITFLK